MAVRWRTEGRGPEEYACTTGVAGRDHVAHPTHPKGGNVILRKFVSIFKWFGAGSAVGRASSKARRGGKRLTLEALEGRYALAQLLWIGPAAGNWSDGTHWVDVDNPANNVTVSRGDTLIFDPNLVVGMGAFQGTNTASINDINNLELSAINVTGNFSATITLNNSLLLGKNAAGENSGATSTMAGGTITGNGDLTIHRFATLNWTGGSLLQPAGGDGLASLTVSQDATVNVSDQGGAIGRNVSNSGTINLSSNLQIMRADRLITNADGGIFDLKGDVGITAGPGITSPGTLGNSGTFRKTQGSGTSTVAPAFTNTAAGNPQLRVQTGTLQLVGAGTQNAGLTVIFNGATLGVTGTYVVNGGTLQGAATSTLRGDLRLTGGSFYVGGDGTVGTFTVTNNYTQTGGTLYIDIDANAQTNDRLQVTNTANLGGNLTVNSLNGAPQGSVTIITYGVRLNDFANKMFLGGVAYTTDVTTNPGEYRLNPLVVGAVNPNAGPTAGGTLVEITGTGFTDATAVYFGSTSVSPMIYSDTLILATSPAGSAGTVHVTVVKGGVTSATSAADQFTYVAAPVVTGLSPSTGPTAGGTSVTISGSNFTGATAVYFSSFAASFTVNSDSSITATSPAYTAGTIYVTVVTAGGTSATSSASEFTYADPLALAGAAVTPAPDATPLTFEQLQPLLAEAIRRWELATGDPQTDSRLRQAQVRLADLPDHFLGLASESAGTIWIDLNAAGHGWFLDLTPSDDSEFDHFAGGHQFEASAVSPALGRVDLLTVVSHELGHLLGLTDLDPLLTPHELMTEGLAASTRRLPSWPALATPDLAPIVLSPSAAQTTPPPLALAPVPVGVLPVEATEEPPPAVLPTPAATALAPSPPDDLPALPAPLLAFAAPAPEVPLGERDPEAATLLAAAPAVGAESLFADLPQEKDTRLALPSAVLPLPLAFVEAPLVRVETPVPAHVPASGSHEALLGGEGDSLQIGEPGQALLLGGFASDPLAPAAFPSSAESAPTLPR